MLAVSVDNGQNRTVYPQKADFTFYGGIYRDVYLLIVPKDHFALDYHGGGIKVTPVVSDGLNSARVTVETWQTGSQPVTLRLGDMVQTAEPTDGYAKAEFCLDAPHLWNGVADPYLYTVTAELPGGDTVRTRFGCRSFEINAEKGFILNGKPLHLCGAARHQDRQGLGSALTKQEHEEDIALLLEMGTNTVRLAHYQHDQYFYDLCHRLDPTRPTTAAHVFMLSSDEPFVMLPDIRSYNLYWEGRSASRRRACRSRRNYWTGTAPC